MIMYRSSTPVQIFISIHWAGGFSRDRWNITVLWLIFLVILYFLFSGTHPGRTRGWIFTVYGSYDVFSPKDGTFGGCDNIGNHLGVISPKHSKKAWIGNFKPNRPNIKIAISYKAQTRSKCNFRKMLGPSNTSCGWSDMTSYQIHDGRRPPFWNLKIRNRPRMVRSSSNIVCRRGNRRKFDFFEKNAKILKSKTADCRHFEIRE